MSNINNWVILDKIENEMKAKIKFFYIFGESGAEVIFVTNDDNVYAYGINKNGSLGLGHSNNTENPTLVEELSNKGLKDIRHGYDFMIALSKSGLCYSWGENSYGQLGNGNNTADNVPKVINGLINAKIIAISCGYQHSHVVTNLGEVYGFGRNEYGQIGCNNKINQMTPVLINGYNNEKVKSISCGANHSLSLTENGHIFSWGYNAQSQLGNGNTVTQITPQLINMNGVIILKIICGMNHSLLLSTDGDVYTFGYNNCGQIGNGNTVNKSSPLKVVNDNKFIAIASSLALNISVAQTEGEFCFIWGESIYGNPYSPKETNLKTINEVLSLYPMIKITYETIYIEEMLESFVDKLAKVFNNQELSDFKFLIDDKVIFVHKQILKINCEHLKTMFSENWDKNDIKEIEVELYSYETYYAFLKYLYTNCVEIGIKDVIELYHLANSYGEEELKPECVEIMGNNISIENAFILYSSAVKYNYKELEKICWEFMSNNMNDVCNTQSFQKWDPIVHKKFIEKAAKLRIFK